MESDKDEKPTQIVSISARPIAIFSKVEVEEEKPRTTVKVFTKKTLRVFGYNVDILLAIVFGLLCSLAGYVFARAKGFSAPEISSWFMEFFELAGIVLSAIVALLAKLAVNRGIISEKIHEIATAFCTETFRTKQTIDPYGNSIVGDKKTYKE